MLTHLFDDILLILKDIHAMSGLSFFKARYFSVTCTDFAERTIGTGLGIALLAGIDLNISL